MAFRKLFGVAGDRPTTGSTIPFVWAMASLALAGALTRDIPGDGVRGQIVSAAADILVAAVLLGPGWLAISWVRQRRTSARR